jgi:pimeloyl-ACP methyl ester carboxylesterase
MTTPRGVVTAVTIGNVKLCYERRGAGSPLVLLHGIGHHWQAWEPVLDRLAAHHDVIAVDLPGFGASPLPPEGLPDGMASGVTAVAEFFDTMGLDRPHVAGNSLGGAVALELAAAGLISSVTVFSPAGFATPLEGRYALAVLGACRLLAHTPEPLLRATARSPFPRAVFFGAIFGKPRLLTPEAALSDTLALRNATGFKAVARASHGYAFTGTPRVPATIAWGTRDRVLIPRQARRAAERLPTARHVSLPGCGHVPMNDDPALVTATILATTGAA